MRRNQTKRQKLFRYMLQKALPIVSHVVAVIGTIAAIIDLIHHW